jgi:hypothetical protein
MKKTYAHTRQVYQRYVTLFFAAFTYATINTLTAIDSSVSISKNLFLQRAFSANTTRELLMQGHVVQTDFDGFYSMFGFDGAYQRSWNQGDATTGIGAFPFWSGSNEMTVGINNGLSNLDAWQFGLGNINTQGSITLNPIVYQGGADFLIYFGSSINDPGIFLKLKAPLATLAINPQLHEVPALLPYPSQYPRHSLPSPGIKFLPQFWANDEFHQ